MMGMQEDIRGLQAGGNKCAGFMQMLKFIIFGHWLAHSRSDQKKVKTKSGGIRVVLRRFRIPGYIYIYMCVCVCKYKIHIFFCFFN